MKKIYRKMIRFLNRWAKPDQEKLVRQLVINVASLAMDRDEVYLLAPLPGCCGPFKLTGNSLPVFTYRVFDKQLMEFIKVTVEVAKPDRISFSSYVDSVGSEDAVNHGKEVELKDQYKRPFLILIQHIYQYFPFVREPMVLQ